MAALTTIAIVGAAAGAGLSAYSSIEQGKTAKKVAEFNAAEQRQEALRLEMDARREATVRQANAKRQLASIRARFAKSGLEMTGTPSEVLAEKKFLLDQEMKEARRQPEAGAKRLRKQAGITEWQGGRAETAGIVNAGSDLLSGAGQIIGML